MSCCKKFRAREVFVSSSLLRPLGDPILHRAGNIALAVSISLLILRKRRVLQFIDAAALNYFYSRVHRSPESIPPPPHFIQHPTLQLHPPSHSPPPHHPPPPSQPPPSPPLPPPPPPP